MRAYSKGDWFRALLLPMGAAGMLLYVGHKAGEKDTRTRHEIAVRLKMWNANPTWAEIQERMDGVMYVEGMHARLAKRYKQFISEKIAEENSVHLPVSTIN